jgi:hypothetical protein
MGASLVFVLGVPVGIGVAVFVGAVVELFGADNSAAWGLLAGVVTGGAFGVLAGRRSARGDYKWEQRALSVASDTEWDAVVMALNVKAAEQHYLRVRKEADYIVFAPMLVRPVALGPLTVSGEYLARS